MRTDRRCAAVTGAVVAAALVVGGGGVLWAALERAARDCPLVVLLGQDIRAEVVAVSFPDEVQGVGGRRMRVGDDRREKFRLGLVTIKITKPAGAALTLPPTSRSTTTMETMPKSPPARASPPSA
jgi:hypothetical protein